MTTTPERTPAACRESPSESQQTNCEPQRAICFCASSKVSANGRAPFPSHLRARNAEHARGLQAGSCWVIVLPLRLTFWGGIKFYFFDYGLWRIHAIPNSIPSILEIRNFIVLWLKPITNVVVFLSLVSGFTNFTWS